MSLATDMFAAYIAAETAVLKGLSYRLGDRQLTRANLPEIIDGRREWERRVAQEQLAARGGDVRYAIADFSGGDQ